MTMRSWDRPIGMWLAKLMSSLDLWDRWCYRLKEFVVFLNKMSKASPLHGIQNWVSRIIIRRRVVCFIILKELLLWRKLLLWTEALSTIVPIVTRGQDGAFFKLLSLVLVGLGLDLNPGTSLLTVLTDLMS